jgi:hypothetical protein
MITHIKIKKTIQNYSSNFWSVQDKIFEKICIDTSRCGEQYVCWWENFTMLRNEAIN